MKIEENHFSASMRINTEDPHEIIMRIREIASYYGEIIENQASQATSGPSNRTKMSFDIIEHMDDHVSINFFFSLLGIKNGISVVEIDIEGILRMDIQEADHFFSVSFQDFYMNKIYPDVKKKAENKIKRIGSEIEKQINELVPAR